MTLDDAFHDDVREFVELAVPLDEPPSMDLSLSVVCPCCGSTEAAKKQVEDAEIGDCPSCCVEFPLVIESKTRKLVCDITRRYARRMEQAGIAKRCNRALVEEMQALMR